MTARFRRRRPYRRPSDFKVSVPRTGTATSAPTWRPPITSRATLWSGSGNGDGTFRTPVSVETGVDPVFISSGDVNKDGRNDLAIAGRLAVAIALGNGDGTFGAARRYLLGHEPRALVVADLNRDGNLDIIAGEGYDGLLLPMNDTGFMAVLFGNGDGTFIGAPVYPAGQSPRDVALADFNGDSRLDAITAGATDSALMLGTAGGGFETPRTIAGLGAAATGDFNGDGRMDMALGQGFSGNTSAQVFLGTGNGAFQTPIQFSTPSSVVSFAPGDFNGDSRTDLAVVFGGPGPSNPTGILILLQNASGALTASEDLAGPLFPIDARAADLNGDSRLDLALVDNGNFGTADQPGGLIVRLGRGDGAFQDPVPYDAGVNPRSVAVGDLNGDNRNDLVVTTNGAGFSNDLAVFLGRDGTLGAATMIPTDFGPASVAIADLNDDGKQDLVVAHCCGETDMTYLLGHGDGAFDSEVHFSGGGGPDAGGRRGTQWRRAAGPAHTQQPHRFGGRRQRVDEHLAGVCRGLGGKRQPQRSCRAGVDCLRLWRQSRTVD